MSSQKLFYSKCKPQDCDAWPVAEKAKRAFVGYPVHVDRKKSADWRKIGCRQLFRDLRDPDWRDSWTSRLAYRSQVSLNRRFALQIGAQSIVLVPRLSSGVCHAGLVTRPFELVDHPKWADDYFDLRRSGGLDTESEIEHVGDIAQTWPVYSWVAIPFAAIPRWISYRLLSRNTVGVIDDLPEAGVTALEAITELMENPGRFWAIDAKNLETDLLNWLSPQTFEHLVVALLQLEADRHTFWHHVGGSGDGGVDGIAVDRKGRLKGKVQCKWFYGGSVGGLLEELSASGVYSVVAILQGTQDSDVRLAKKQEFWNRRTIAALVRKHRRRLPIAGSLGLWKTS